MPDDTNAAFVAIDEVQLAADPERGHVFTDRIMNLRGRQETMLLGAATIQRALQALLPGIDVITRPRMSMLTWAGQKKITRLPRRSAIVAFSAICAHRMSYPTRDISFISYRNESVRFMDRDRNARRKEQVIYCCSEGSVYDPAEGGRVLGGPAPQPLAAVDLTCGEDGTITACGTYGGDMFERFFENFAFQLSLVHGTRDFQDPAEGTSVVMPLEEYTRNQRIC
jgi:Rieske Fe-S protein